MDEHTCPPEVEGRLATVENEVAVISASYVRKDEFAALRADNARAFGAVDANFAKVYGNFAKVDAKFAKVYEEIAKVRAEIAQQGLSMIKWMVAMNITMLGLVYGMLKYVH